MFTAVPFTDRAIGEVDRDLQFTHVDHADVADATTKVGCNREQWLPPRLEIGKEVVAGLRPVRLLFLNEGKPVGLVGAEVVLFVFEDRSESLG